MLIFQCNPYVFNGSKSIVLRGSMVLELVFKKKESVIQVLNVHVVYAFTEVDLNFINISHLKTWKSVARPIIYLISHSCVVIIIRGRCLNDWAVQEINLKIFFVEFTCFWKTKSNREILTINERNYSSERNWKIALWL